MFPRYILFLRHKNMWDFYIADNVQDLAFPFYILHSLCGCLSAWAKTPASFSRTKICSSYLTGRAGARHVRPRVPDWTGGRKMGVLAPSSGAFHIICTQLYIITKHNKTILPNVYKNAWLFPCKAIFTLSIFWEKKGNLFGQYLETYFQKCNTALALF